MLVPAHRNLPDFQGLCQIRDCISSILAFARLDPPEEGAKQDLPHDIFKSVSQG